MKENMETDNITPNAAESLREIKSIWSNLQREPYGTYLPNGGLVSPSQGNYMYNVDRLVRQVEDLCNETSDSFNSELHSLYHTVDKECSYVKNFRTGNSKSRENHDTELSGLMREANEQIAVDLFSILRLTEEL